MSPLGNSKFYSLCFVHTPGPELTFSSTPGSSWVGHLSSPRLNLACLQPYARRRGRPLQRGTQKMNVCLAFRQLGPQKPRDTRKEAPGTQAPSALCSINIGTNPSSIFTPANREENKERAVVVSPAQPLVVKFPTLGPAKTRDLHRSLSARRARARRYLRFLAFLPYMRRW